MFIIKKIIAPLFYPVPLCLELILAGLVLLWLTRRQRTGKVLVSMGAALLILFGYPVLSNRLLRPLEYRHPPVMVTTEHADRTGTNAPVWVAVMGCGYTPTSSLPANSQASSEFLARFLEAVRLYRALPDARLLVSVAGAVPVETKCLFMDELAAIVAVDPADIHIVGDALDTKDEARLMRGIIGTEPFFLVTSAHHIPRSTALFRGQGMHPIPAPADHQVKGGPAAGFNVSSLYPNGTNLLRAERAVHEYIGLCWAKIRGQLNAAD